VLTVAADPDLVERLLRDGELVCPRCGEGVLGGHGWVPGRWLRMADGLVVLFKAHATVEEISSGTVAPGLRRGRCKAAGCQATHVLAPPAVLWRRLDEAGLIGAVLEGCAEGLGYRRIAGRLGRVRTGVLGQAAELGVVRRCVARFTANAGRLRAAFTALVHRVDSSPPVMTSGGCPVAEAVAAIGEAAAAVRRLLGTRLLAVSPWMVAAAVSNGSLLAVTPQDRLFSTSRHLPAAT
jgi:hypothetical protein